MKIVPAPRLTSAGFAWNAICNLIPGRPDPNSSPGAICQQELDYALGVYAPANSRAGETGAQETNVKRVSDAARMATIGIAVAALTAGCSEPPPAAAPPPPEVLVADVIQRDVPVYLELVGQTLGFQDVEIRARVEGYLTNMSFQEGSLVRKGDLLYEIDRLPLEAILAQAKADQATAEARLAKANNDVARYRPLVAKQAVSQRELDDAVAEQDAARSQVDAAKAAVDKATLDLSYTRITAPDQRAHRRDAGQDRQPRRPRREHAADDDLPDRSRAVPRRRHRGRLPADRAAQHRQAAARAGRRAASG